VEPQDAWRAAGAVEPGDLHPDTEDGDRLLSFEPTDDGTAWITDDGHRISDVVRAVALEEGLIEAIDEELINDTFDEAYRRARWYYNVPMPEYIDETMATEHRWVIQGALRQIEDWHLDSIRSEVTGLGNSDVVAEIDPCWADSASGRRILAFESGLFYCREHEKALDPLRFVALEEGILDGCEDSLGEEGSEYIHICTQQSPTLIRLTHPLVSPRLFDSRLYRSQALQHGLCMTHLQLVSHVERSSCVTQRPFCQKQ